MTGDLTPADGIPEFESLGVANGITHWAEDVLRKRLGYVDPGTFRKVIKKAMTACLTADCETEEHFVKGEDGNYTFTRFACYLISIAADNKKPEVAEVQAYLAKMADTFQTAMEHTHGIERLIFRKDLADGEVLMSSAAKQHGVSNYPFFHNAGYRGLYNMNYSTLAARKGVPKGEKLIDRMGSEELGANIFRVTQTAAKIKASGPLGQDALEAIAHSVGKMVRLSVIEISGKKPEDLPLEEHIKDVRKKVKGTSKSFKRLDGKKKAKKKL